MKKKQGTRVLIYASTAVALTALPLSAAPDSKPPAMEHRIEIHATDAAAPGRPVQPPAPVTFLGLEVEPADEALAAQLKLPMDHGLIVRFVVPDSPAAAAGVQKHDVLTRLDDQWLITPQQLSALVRSRREGDAVKLTYLRAGAEARTSATLAQRVPPPVHATDTLRWIGRDLPTVPGMPAQRSFVFRTENGHAAATGADTLGVFAPPADGTPRVMVFRPRARIVYCEGETTLEVTTTESGRQLEARGADGAVIFSGPINTPEQRAAVPADLQKHLEKLDALEPAPFHLPAAAPGASWTPAQPAAREDVLMHFGRATSAEPSSGASL